MAPLRSNLVQYSPHQAEEAARAVSDIDFTFTKHFQDGLLTAFWLPQSLPGPRSSVAHRSDCINIPIVQWPRVICRGWIIL